MRMGKILAVAAVALAAAACSRQGSVKVVFNGATPATGVVKFERYPDFYCPGCGKKIDDYASQPKMCSDKKCQAKITWPDKMGCAYCAKTGECPTCRMMKQDAGKCYNCGGSGTMVLPLEGTRPRSCPNCKGSGKCPTCEKDPGKCDFCHGEKDVAMNVLQTKATEHAQGKKE